MPNQTRPHHRTVAIIGGGFSGAATAVHLLRIAPAGTVVVLIEPKSEIGRGLAYSTPHRSHRLNVPAGRLGIDPDQESGFIDWLHARGEPCLASDFLPRHLFGTYVSSEVERIALEARQRGLSFRHLKTSVIGMSRSRPPYRLVMADDQILEADVIVLATGHSRPVAPALAGNVGWSDAGMAEDPWRSGTLASPDRSREILVLGSGLTAIDVVSQLRDQGHVGRIHLISRRGLLPQPHRIHEARPPLGLSPAAQLGDELSLRHIFHAVREWSATAQASGGDWRDVMASLRPWTTHLWQRLTARDRRQFLRHLQPFWETHRHRVAAPVFKMLSDLMASGEVGLHAGHIERIDRADDGRIAIRWRPRGGARIATLHVDLVANCTGATVGLGCSESPLSSSLANTGVLVPDVLKLGIQVDAQLRAIDSSGVPADSFYYVGPMLKAQRWEAVAVPELRNHARDVARHILAEFDKRAATRDVASAC